MTCKTLAQDITQSLGATSAASSDLFVFARNGQTYNIPFQSLTASLGVTGCIKSQGSETSVSILSQPASGYNYIRAIEPSQGITATVSNFGGLAVKTNFINGVGGSAIIADTTAQQIKFKSLVGGVNTTITESENTLTIDVEESNPLSSQKIVRSAADFDNPLNPAIQYFIDGSINLASTVLTIGAGGANISGLGVGVSSLVSSAAGYTMFNSGSCANVFINGVDIEVSGAGSSVFSLTDSDGTHAVEFSGVNFTNCTSLGELNGFRQVLEINTGRFGGSPELTLSGSMNGYRSSASIAQSLNNGTTLFKNGTLLTFSGRFVTDINADMAATGAIFDFSAANFANDESMIINDSYVTRIGVLDASDSTLYPNLDHKSVKSNWSSNTGMPNTKKYIKSSCSAEVATVLSGVAIGTYLPLSGTFSVLTSVQLDMPSNGEFRLLTGNGTYNISGTVQIKGTAGDLVDLRVTLSQDNGATYPTQIGRIQLEIHNFTGTNDFATYGLNFIRDLKKNDRVRLEVENNTGARDVTMIADSFIIISGV
jgi:hypothetical protein